MGVDVGYTWASNYSSNIFAVSAKVTNGLNADGSEILFSSTKNSKDVWFDADYWFGPDGGVTFMMYHGSKDQIQNQGDADRVHLPSHHLPRTASSATTCSSTSWMFSAATSAATTTGRLGSGSADVATTPRTATAARWTTTSSPASRSWRGYDAAAARASRRSPTMHTQRLGHRQRERALTELGNVVLRATYNQEHDADPVALRGTTDKLFKLDVRFMW